MITKALVINGNAISLMVACKLINKAQFANETITASSGQMALAYFDDFIVKGDSAKALPEFIFLDLYMPGMNGWDFLEIFSQKYASRFPGVKVAIISSYLNEDDMVRLEKYGVVLDCIASPMNLGRLEEVRDKFIRTKHVHLS
jgi:CheY-like chemotaxis protein